LEFLCGEGRSPRFPPSFFSAAVDPGSGGTPFSPFYPSSFPIWLPPPCPFLFCQARGICVFGSPCSLLRQPFFFPNTGCSFDSPPGFAGFPQLSLLRLPLRFHNTPPSSHFFPPLSRTTLERSTFVRRLWTAFFRCSPPS